MIKTLATNLRLQRATYIIVGLLSLGLFLKNAWVAEDAFIILRSIDQFLAGNGFRWNPHERVQVYTSPLWYLLIIASTAFCKTLYLNLIGLSLALHLALLMISAFLLKNIRPWLLLVLLLSVSQGFFDFTASGLEYPLIYALLATFVLLYLKNRHREDINALMLCAGLLLITRHDTLLLILPLLLHLIVSCHKQLSTAEKWQAALLLAGPLAAWTLFSLLYYGMPFPNTAYGKLNIDGVSRLERLTRGWIYLATSLRTDPITPMLIALATVHGFCSRQTLPRVVSAGLLLNMTYIFWIGGDYMLGRFYAPLYLVAAILFVQQDWRLSQLRIPVRLLLGLCSFGMVYYLFVVNLQTVSEFMAAHQLPAPSTPVLIGALLLIGTLLLSLHVLPVLLCRRIGAVLLIGSLLFSTQQYDSPWQSSYKHWGKNSDFDMWWNLNNVSRERYFIYHWTSLYAWLHRDPAKLFPDHPWCHEGAAMPAVEVIGLDGIIGYCMGIDKIAIDIKALTDPLLARMPKTPQARWSSGGVNRMMPAGYIQSVSSGENRIEDPDLARYYEQLQLITSSESLFSTARLQAIIAFHWGAYDPWLQAAVVRLQAHAAQKP